MNFDEVFDYYIILNIYRLSKIDRLHGHADVSFCIRYWFLILNFCYLSIDFDGLLFFSFMAVIIIEGVFKALGILKVLY